MHFDFKHSKVFPALRWCSYFNLTRNLGKLFLVLFILFIFFFLYGFLGNYSIRTLKIVFSGSLFLLVFSVFFTILFVFFKEKLVSPPQTLSLSEVAANISQFNILNFLDFEIAKALYQAFKFSQKKGYVLTSSIFFYFLLLKNKSLDFFFSRGLFSRKEIENLLKKSFVKKRDKNLSSDCSEDMKKTLIDALGIAAKNNHRRIKISDILVSLSRNNYPFKRIIVKSALKLEDIEDLADWWERIEKIIEKRKKFFAYNNLLRKGSIGRNFSAGYTVTLDRYAIEWTDLVKNKERELMVGHEQELKALERILAQPRINNVLLVGEPGVGRKTLVEKLSLDILQGRSLSSLNYKRVVELNLPSLLSEVDSMEKIEFILDKIFSEVALAGNTILLIDNIHNYFGGEQRPGVVDISGVISRYLHLPQFQIIGVTTYEGLHRNFEQNPSVLSLFQKVEVPPLSQKESLEVIENFVPSLEKKYGVFFSFASLELIIDYSDRYITNVPFPQKAMDLIDEVAVYVSRETKAKIILPDHVSYVVSEKTQIPVGGIRGGEKEILLDLEELIHKRIINQNEAVRDISSALRRAREEVTIRKGPMGSFLFLGPTGVGKTETAKALTEIYFGSESKMIRLDMSEFQNLGDIKRLIGSLGEEGFLTTQIREEPFSLVLLDEFEKAHPNILNLFLQVLDEGYLTDGVGRKVDFRNTIIIATSNAGYKIILDALKKNIPFSEIKEKLMDYLYQKAIFRPELINRFDSVVIFRALTRENLLKIAELLLRKLKDSLKEKEVDFVITEDLKEKIVELSYSPIYGAREMRRVIQDKMGDSIAKAFLRGEIQRGDKIKVDPQDFRVIKV